MKLYPYEIRFLICLIPFLPGIYGVVRTRAWRRPRLWLWVFLLPWLAFFGMGIQAPALRFWGGMAILAGILFVLEIAFIFLLSDTKKLAFKQLTFFLLCLPMLHHFWGRYGGYFIDI